MTRYTQNPDGLSSLGRAVGATRSVTSRPQQHVTTHLTTQPGPAPTALERLAYGLAEAASVIGVGTTLMRELLAQRQIPSFRLGRRVLIRKSDLAAFIDGESDVQHGGAL